MEESCKRPREEGNEDEQGACLKKLCQGLGIEEEEEVICREDDTVVQEDLLSGVMKSLEDEINVSSGSSTPSRHELESAELGYQFFDDSSSEDAEKILPLADEDAVGDCAAVAAVPERQSSSLDFSYLLEASDDELGISCSSPALSEADLSCVPCDEQTRASNILDDFLGGEVLNLGSEFPELGQDGQEWLRRAIATLDVVIDSSSATATAASVPPPAGCSSSAAALDSAAKPLLVESSGL